MINIIKNPSTRVDAVFKQVGDDLYVKFIRTDEALGTSHWEMFLDPIDLEHLIATLIEQQAGS